MLRSRYMYLMLFISQKLLMLGALFGECQLTKPIWTNYGTCLRL